MTDMCKHADEMPFDRDDDIIDITNFKANQAAFFSDNSKAKETTMVHLPTITQEKTLIFY